VDNACYKCGSPVQPGTAFCPSCGAPQIRVTVPDAAPVDSPIFVPGTPAEMQPPAQPVQLGAQPLREFDVTAIQWRRALWPVVVGGVVAGFLPQLAPSLLWLVVCIMGGAAIAVGLYHHRESLNLISRRMGAKVGIAAATVGYTIDAVLATLLFCFVPQQRTEMLKQIQELPSRAPNPESANLFREIAQKMSTPEGLALLFSFSLIVAAVLFLIFGALGGVIGAKLTRRHDSQR